MAAMRNDLTETSTPDPGAELASWARRLPVPADMFVGPANLCDVLPREVLAFYRHRELSSDPVWSHHRFVLLMCLEGEGGAIVDGTLHRLSPGRAILVFPYQNHHYTGFVSASIRWLFLTFEMDDERFLTPLRDRTVGVRGEDLARAARVVRCYAAYRAGQLSQASPIGLWMGLLLSQLVLGAGRRRREGAKRADDPRLARLQPVLRHVHRHVDRWPGTRELARLSHWSPSQLRRVFAQVMGMTLGRYLRHARVNRACGLLHRTDLSITQVSARCGFSSVFAFSRTFRQVTGVSPSRYRRNLARGKAPAGARR